MALPPVMELEPGRVRARGLSTRFRLYHSRPRGIKERLFRFERAVYEEFFALKDVSFEVAPGESFAVIGANGSGKSTLLKCLTGILPPDNGEIGVGGKSASLLELGAGFHGDLSGRENVYLNGSILGMRRRDLDEVFDDIVRFAGVEEFIDTPVRNYSSGMYVRLGFSIAVNADPDVLLIDEILAVGDAAFQTKCFEKMHDFKRRGKTIVLVTHDLDAAARLCDKGILLDRGVVVAEGTARSVVDTYRQRILASQTGEPEAHMEPKKRWGTGEAEIVEIALIDDKGQTVESVTPGDFCSFRLAVRFKQDLEEPIFGYIVRADDGMELFNTNTMWRGIPTGSYKAGEIVEVAFRQRMNLLPGRYVFTTAVAHRDATQWYDWWEDCLFFHVVGTSINHGYVNLEADVEFGVLSKRMEA